ncbi:UDP-glucose--hexose-1-phosphate uridylyltransferase [Heyndrickxia oleronia]|uniref:Galactose-1-phosphate uridylyltransferase n=1 Tax=Heyndrickxia oleronia TaxID=38875 RepID=A0AAW6SR70_9BACI|nr:UDP-glucose--hexose-1-phosphate uridylyltransferase [Heyndrickxia oleronia]MDH5159464.1 UDP-glucose--hexose-1-phosphate uridylyltransferase [Heyndrickxia oleronia]
MNPYLSINELVYKAISLRMIQPEDEIYARNQIMALLGLTDFSNENEQKKMRNLDVPELLDELVLFAVQKGLIEDLFDAKEILSSHIMNVFLQRPSEINQNFYRKWEQSPEKATSYFYELSQNSNYIQTKRIAENSHYKITTEYGELDITINLAKPEKDPNEIAKENERKIVSNYPTCLLCVENEGYSGRIGHPARSNHRMIRLELNKERWYFQYSPYVYYKEHCIILSHDHRNMVINQATFQRIFEFVGKFPHYFIGSNADLPIVGGSILSHDHYQGGNYEFAMAKAKDEMIFTLDSFPKIHTSTIKWPMSVIRLRSSDVKQLVDACNYILEKWKNYSDPAADIVAYTGETRHNTITPIARIRNNEFEIDLVLRNNRTNKEHPLGIFHPHADVHHIKKENIGLIEVMGLAVLPARLKTELLEVEKYLLDQPNQIQPYHRIWADDMKIRYQNKITPTTVKEIILQEVGYKFLRVLEDASVFKRTEGQKAFQKFISSL